MAELKRKDEELTTADLAGRTNTVNDPESRPRLVKNEQGTLTDNTYDNRLSRPDSASRDLDAPNQQLTSPGSDVQGGAQPATNASDAQQARFGGDAAANASTPLFAETEVGDFRSRWSSVQTAFVDEPRRAVEDADNLVASLMKKLAEGFANERERLEKQWDRGDNVSTEDLRLALQRYRSFFDRLLKV